MRMIRPSRGYSWFETSTLPAHGGRTGWRHASYAMCLSLLTPKWLVVGPGRSRGFDFHKDLISPQLGWRHRWVVAEESRLSGRFPIAASQTREQIRVFRGDLVVIRLAGEAQHCKRLGGDGDNADSVVTRSR